MFYRRQVIARRRSFSMVERLAPILCTFVQADVQADVQTVVQVIVEVIVPLCDNPDVHCKACAIMRLNEIIYILQYDKVNCRA